MLRNSHRKIGYLAGMNALVADLGNSRIKTAWTDGAEMGDTHFFETETELYDFARGVNPTHSLLCSTRGRTTFEAWPGALTWLDYTTPLPFQNHYATPATLGPDRLAAAVAAHFLYPGEDCLIVDAGTCVTYELYSASEGYLGGAISPGLRLRMRAMAEFTAALPLVSAEFPPSDIGDSTEHALQAGGLFGLVSEIEGMRNRYTGRYPHLHTLLTGGDASRLESHLEAPFFAHPNLILVGLSRLLAWLAVRG